MNSRFLIVGRYYDRQCFYIHVSLIRHPLIHRVYFLTLEIKKETRFEGSLRTKRLVQGPYTQDNNYCAHDVPQFVFRKFCGKGREGRHNY